MPQRRVLGLVASALAAGALLVGCGSDPPGPAPGSGSPPPPPAPALAGGPPLEVKLTTCARVVVRSAGVEVVTLEAGEPGKPLGGLPEGAKIEAAGEILRLGENDHRGPLELRSLPGIGGRPTTLSVEWGQAGGPFSCRGVLRLSASQGQIVLTNRLSLEEYLASVVGSELPAGAAPLEALKAQAIAARSFALYAIQAREARGQASRLAADATFQVYGGLEREHPRSVEAVLATRGLVLTYKGKLFRSYFHSACGGHTADASQLFAEPPITPFRGVECTDCAATKGGAWKSVWSQTDLAGALTPWCAGRGIQLGPIEALRVAEADPQGRVRYVKVIHGGGRSFEMLGSSLRALLGARPESPVRSTLFTVVEEGGGFVFEGRGWGHGAGLCQSGALVRGSRQGYRELLVGYYPGADLERAYEY